jgi:glucosamine-6-phosphate deaminase
MPTPSLSVHSSPELATQAAADLLGGWLVQPGVRNVMLAAGNTPLGLYREIADRKLLLAHLNLFALDEYVGVPVEEPRNCANLIRRTAVEPWGVPDDQYFTVSSSESQALPSVLEHERRIEAAGGIDVLVLGLGQNGHLGFNEPGSEKDSGARVLDLDPISIEANRQWFGGDYAPSRGATVGMRTILAARRIVILAYGDHKAEAARDLLQGPISSKCPASFLQAHPETSFFIDRRALSKMNPDLLRHPG